MNPAKILPYTYLEIFVLHKVKCRTNDDDWVVYKLGVILGSVGHKVKIHKITPATGKERGDIEIKDYVV